MFKVGTFWKVCNGYGTVVDVFIPNKRSKAGKHFAFVRFINVLNLDRLIENLKTIWIGRFHLSANLARFERPKASTFQKEKPVPSGNVTGFKQSIVQNQGGPKESYSSILKPSLVLDDSCLVNRDLTNCVMGEVLQFSSINNLQHNFVRDLLEGPARVFESIKEAANSVDRVTSEKVISMGLMIKEGGSILEILEEISTLVKQWAFLGRRITDTLLLPLEVLKQLHDVQSSNNRDIMQKAKIRWAIEGDENSKYFHAIINKKRANLSVKGIMVDGDWIVEPDLVKQEFRRHFTDRFQDPGSRRGSLNFPFPNRLNNDQILELESPISNEDIRTAVWGCGVDKSPGPDGFTFKFFRKYWTVVGPDFCIAVKWFFDHGDFAIGCNSSFVALIPKVLDPKVVSDYRPISLIGSLYKVVTKILASRLSLVISDLISDVQTAFLPNRQILDGPFIINEILARCKLKKQQAMIFKVDFAKAYDSVRWDYLDDVLISFGFGPKWRSWIRGSLSSGKASILVNGSPTTEFHLYRGLKQGDPLAPFLFLLIMESLHLSFSRAVEAYVLF
ncbi:RNA-directed DNA polymerase, eukaryota [Tanacetum coccineum]